MRKGDASVTDTVVIPLGPLGTLELPRAVFDAHLRPNVPDVHPGGSKTDPPAPLLVSAARLGELTETAASWWLAAAREDDCPCVRLGSSVRFDPQAALKWLNERQERDAVGRSISGPTPRARALSVTVR